MSTPTPIPTSLKLSDYFSTPAQAPKVIPRLAVSLDAQDKCGKSHWSLMTTPEPICHVVINDNIAMYQKALAEGRKVPHFLQVDFSRPDPKVLSATDVDKEELKQWRLTWHRFKSAMKAVAQDRTVKTLVWDTATELWHLAELSHFGKLRGNARIDIRTELNADFSGVFWDLYKTRPDLNMVLIHKTKKQYETVLNANGNPAKDNKGETQREWNGRWERDGYNNAGFLVDMTLQAGWDGGRRCFYTHINPNQATRYGTHLTGETWYGEESGFIDLALKVFPETESTPEVWGL